MSKHEQEQEPLNKLPETADDVQKVVKQAAEDVEQSKVSSHRARRRTYILIAAYLIVFALFALLAWSVHVYPVLKVDIKITREFQEHQPLWLNVLMFGVSYLGNNIPVFSVLILLTAVVFWLVRLRLEALFILGLSIVNLPVNIILKTVINRPRPTTRLVDVLQNASGNSFPSGHVMSYVAYWGLLFSLCLILFKRDRWWHYVLLIVSGFFVIMVGPSRVYLGDHWATDVLGGYMFGGLLLGLTLWLYLMLKGYQAQRKVNNSLSQQS